MSSIFTALFGRIFNLYIPIWIFESSQNINLVPIGNIVASTAAILTGLLAGFLVDIFDRRKSFIFINIAGCLIFTSVFFFGLNYVPVIYIIIFLVTSITRIIYSLRISLIHAYADKNDLLIVNSRLAIIFSCSLFIGPLIISFGFNEMSLNRVFLCYAAIFLMTSILAFLLKNSEVKVPIKSKKIANIKSFKEIFKNPVLRYNILFVSVIVLQGEVYTSLIYLYLKGVFNDGEVIYGNLIAMQGAGSIVSGIVIKYIHNKISSANFMFTFALAIGLLEISYLSFPNVTYMFVAIFVIGFLNQTMMVYTTTVFQENISTEIVGKAVSVKQTIVNITSLVGSSLAGVLVVAFNVKFVLITSIAITLPVASILSYSMFKKRKFQSKGLTI